VRAPVGVPGRAGVRVPKNAPSVGVLRGRGARGLGLYVRRTSTTRRASLTASARSLNATRWNVNAARRQRVRGGRPGGAPMKWKTMRWTEKMRATKKRSSMTWYTRGVYGARLAASSPEL
jgi:hypothetical protein